MGKPKHLFFYLLLIVWAGFQIVQLDSEWDRMDGDDAQYIMHARSLLQNHQYNDPKLFYTPNPFFGSKSAPPGWPLLLVPIVALLGINLIAIKLLVVCFAFVSGIVLFHVIRNKSENDQFAFFIAAIYYFSMTTIVFSRVAYSEWPYLLVSLLLIQFILQDKIHMQEWLKWLIVGIGLGLAMLFRSIGVALILSVIAVYIQEMIIEKKTIRKKWIYLALMLFMAACVYQLGNRAVQPEKSPGYEEQFLSKDIDYQDEGRATLGDVLLRSPVNSRYFIKSLFPLLFGRSWHEYVGWVAPNGISHVEAVLYCLGILIFSIIILGFYHEMKKRPTVVEYYTLFYLMIMVVIWFHYEVYRYLMPIASFLFFYFFVGLRFLFKKTNKNQHVFFGLLIACLSVNMVHAGVEIYRYKYSSKNAKILFAPYHEAVAWLKQNTASNDMIVADDPRWYALETGLSVTMFPISKDVQKVIQYFNQFSHLTVVYDNNRRFSKACLLPVLEAYHTQFKLIKQFGHLEIYQYGN